MRPSSNGFSLSLSLFFALNFNSLLNVQQKQLLNPTRPLGSINNVRWHYAISGAPIKNPLEHTIHTHFFQYNNNKVVSSYRRWCICSSRWSMQLKVVPWMGIDINRVVIHRVINCRIQSLSSSISDNWPIWGVSSTYQEHRPSLCRCHLLPGLWQLHQNLVDERRTEDCNAQSVENKLNFIC